MPAVRARTWVLEAGRRWEQLLTGVIANFWVKSVDEEFMWLMAKGFLAGAFGWSFRPVLSVNACGEALRQGCFASSTNASAFLLASEFYQCLWSGSVARPCGKALINRQQTLHRSCWPVLLAGDFDRCFWSVLLVSAFGQCLWRDPAAGPCGKGSFGSSVNTSGFLLAYHISTLRSCIIWCHA